VARINSIKNLTLPISKSSTY